MAKATRRGPRGDLSLDSVVAAGRSLALAGATPVTLRAVARQLEVLPNALYTYVSSTEQLRHLVGDALLADLDLTSLTDDSCPACAVAAVTAQVEQLFVDHPGAAALFASGRVIGRHSLALNEGLLACLMRAGLDAADASRAVSLLTTLVHGAATLAGTHDLTPQDRAQLTDVDPTDYPLTAATPTIDDQLADDAVRILRAFGVPACGHA
ncbi:TetR/AcrR family transcriptional regulator C-terminal domain-containing protein [Microlunatus sp. Y2014]|uniref:TetR/AcrR family transcriptional regulator C-terminal domain-containing protein n=1 Tax=Microlunatus sp. Y2014 TaxID=3418488 RepID=UPI003DA6D065